MNTSPVYVTVGMVWTGPLACLSPLAVMIAVYFSMKYWETGDIYTGYYNGLAQGRAMLTRCNLYNQKNTFWLVDVSKTGHKVLQP